MQQVKKCKMVMVHWVLYPNIKIYLCVQSRYRYKTDIEFIVVRTLENKGQLNSNSV